MDRRPDADATPSHRHRQLLRARFAPMPDLRPPPLLNLILILVLTLAETTPTVAAQDAPAGPRTQAWSEGDPDAQALLERHLTSAHWTFRVFALMRLERYHGPEVAARVRTLVQDPTWQVRCFALRAADRIGVTIEPGLLEAETHERVIRAALRTGVALDPDKVALGVERLLDGDLDRTLLGIEMAAATDDDRLRAAARRRLGVLIQRMDDATALRARDRLLRLTGADPTPPDAMAWRAWAVAQGRSFDLAPPATRTSPDARTMPPAWVATLDDEIFARLMNYLDALRSKRLEMAIVMDSTSSMLPMLNEARIGVEDLITFFADIAGSMRLGFVAYRDHDNPPIWEGEHLTDDIDAMRRFLWDIRISGGRDLPEAVFEGLEACGQLDWTPESERRVVLVGDARPHDEDEYRVAQLVEAMRSGGVVVHAVHVPMRIDPQWARAAAPAARRAYEAEVETHNVRTGAAFEAIARLGGGQHVTLEEARGLVPRLMRLTIDEAWWPAFDEFHRAYGAECR